MTGLKGFMIYLIFLIAFIIQIRLMFGVKWFPGVIPFLFYLASGWTLNRKVLRHLIDWHPVNKTIDNVSNTKFKALLFWPIFYPPLFFKLGIMKHL
ncbi:MAG: hypothetical protein KGL63_13615 [Betaproteobacteria bacterium]|nr:hypothetical protein [Betaproteobacteria bacterium]